MKLNQILMCAAAAGAMAFVSNQAQAGVVINNDLYTPLNVKGTFSYVKSAGKIKQVTFTSKDILKYEGYAKGIMLAIGPDQHVYAISKTAVLDDLTVEGYFVFSTTTVISTVTDVKSWKRTEIGTVIFDFYSDADNSVEFPIIDNTYVFQGTGIYNLTETESNDNSKGIYTETDKFKSTLGGTGYDFDVSESLLPVTGTSSGSGSGPIVY